MPEAAWGALLSFLLTIILALTTYIVRSDRKDREKDREIVRETQRHLDSLIKSQWLLIWRVNGLEDFLNDKLDFKPPRIIGEAEVFGRE